MSAIGSSASRVALGSVIGGVGTAVVIGLLTDESFFHTGTDSKAEAKASLNQPVAAPEAVNFMTSHPSLRPIPNSFLAPVTGATDITPNDRFTPNDPFNECWRIEW
jgi:hypothetical protein